MMGESSLEKPKKKLKKKKFSTLPKSDAGKFDFKQNKDGELFYSIKASKPWQNRTNTNDEEKSTINWDEFPERKKHSTGSPRSQFKLKPQNVQKPYCNAQQAVTNETIFHLPSKQMGETKMKNKFLYEKVIDEESCKLNCTKVSDESSENTKFGSNSLHKRNQNKKKKGDAIVFNLEAAFEKGLAKSSEKRKENGSKSKFHRYLPKEKLSGNVLDSANPKRNKGKHREIQKKRISKLKVLIVKERILKQILKNNAESLGEIPPTRESLNALQKNLQIDFKREIEKYFKQLDQKRNVDSSAVKKAKIIAAENPEKKEPEPDTKRGEKFESNYLINPEVNPGNLIKDDAKTCGDSKQVFFKKKLYRENAVTSELNAAVKDLIAGVVHFQDRAFSRDPIKAKAKRRHVVGLKEVKRNLILKRVKMLIVAPNLEQLHMEGSVGDLIEEMKTLAKAQNVPCVFALNRVLLGRCTKKFVPVSAFAILNYDGLEERYEEVMRSFEKAKKEFSESSVETAEENKRKSELEEINAPLISSLVSAFKENLSVSQADPEGPVEATNVSM